MDLLFLMATVSYLIRFSYGSMIRYVKWYKRGVKETNYVRKENPTLRRGLRHYRPKACHAAIKKFPKRLSSRNKFYSVHGILYLISVTPSRIIELEEDRPT